jgi:hypothetical protein
VAAKELLKQVVMHVVPDHVRAQILRDGYYVTETSVPGAEALQSLVRLGESLGELFIPKQCDPSEPVIRTSPKITTRAAPFDRPEAIGWHSDFATYDDRPELSLVYIVRADPRGGNFGAWRVASVGRVLELMRATQCGLEAFDVLCREPLPFSYAMDEEPRWFKVIETRPGGRLGLRFYLRSLRRGCMVAYGEIPKRVSTVLSEVTRATDQVGQIVRTKEGSLLVVSNWFALHDRLRQTAGRDQANREALLCFVDRSFA